MRNSIFVFLIFLVVLAKAQPDAWIAYDQEYYKLKIAEAGWYRITAEELVSSGFPTAQVAASGIQLFRRGQELAIRTIANEDNTLNYLEFWGEGNDGRSDVDIYEPGAQSHTDYNLFSDTAVYFMTWNNSVNGLRITTNSNNSSDGLVASSYYLSERKIIQTSSYHLGRRFGVENSLQLSAYDISEGWTGPFRNKNGFQDFDLSMDNPVVSGPEPRLTITAIGGNSKKHIIEISAGPDESSRTVIGTLTFEGYSFIDSTIVVPWDRIGPTGQLSVRSTVLGEPEIADRASIARLNLEYPQEPEITTDRVFNTENIGSDRVLLSISGIDPSSYEFLDITNPLNPIRLPGSGSNPVEVVVPNAQNSRTIAAYQSPKTVPSVRPYVFEEINLVNKDYLIITHPLLHLGEDSDPIEDYAAYRTGASGGGHGVVIADIDDVYDQYNYGDPSPIAIRRLIETGFPDISNVFLIGRGYTPNQDYYRLQFTKNSFISRPVMVPTFGFPGSDSRYTIGLQGVDQQDIPIGRLSVYTADEVSAYLNKVKEMESLAYTELWRKNLIHLSGGQTSSELSVFANYVNDFAAIAEGDLLGGDVKIQGKQTDAVSEFISIADEVNNGVGMIMLFGHSSNLVTDIEIGRPSQQSQDGTNYLNKGKYPFILVNGCKAGEIFGESTSFGEDWMATADKGSIGFIAHADLATPSNLYRFTNLFYTVAYTDESFFGKSVGEIMVEVGKRYFEDAGVTDLSRTQVYQTLLQGDPAVRVFGADQPDYRLSSDDIFESSFSGAGFLAQEDSFLVNVVVENYGRTIRDSIEIEIQRTLDNGVQITSRQQFVSPKYRDTLSVVISNIDLADVEGNNVFDISIDPDNEVAELNESNNTVTYSFFLTAGSTYNLYPDDLGVVTDGDIDLIWQPINLLEERNQYDLEYDLSPAFNSASLRSLQIEGQDILSHTVNSMEFGSDSVVVYWRTRRSGSDTDTIWSTRSFSIVPGESEGWGQFDFNQLSFSDLTDLEINNTTYRFPSIESVLNIETIGTSNYSYENLRVVIDGTDFLVTNSFADPECAPNTLNAIAIDRVTGQIFQPIPQSGADELNPLICGRLPQFVYNFTTTNLFTEGFLEQLVDGLSSGDFLLLFSIDSLAYSGWDETITSQLERIGVSTGQLSGLVDGQPIIILGQRDANQGSATVIKNDGSILPVKEQLIRLQTTVISQPNTGLVSTPRIGPAREWRSISYSIEEDEEDFSQILFYGVDRSGNMELFLPEAQFRTIDQSFSLEIDADEYPFLEAVVFLADSTGFTPPELKNIHVTYEKPPEGALYIVDKDIQNLQEGELFETSIGYVNLSDQAFNDSLEIRYFLRNPDLEDDISITKSFEGLQPGDTLFDTYSFSSSGWSGSNQLKIEVLPREDEIFSSNNRFTLNPYAEVKADDINPVLDITFDGIYIMNGDIVSADPTILITLKDENVFTFKQDTTGVQLQLRAPGESSMYQRVSLEDPRVNWVPATEDQDFQIELRPGPLEDGIHSLRIQAQDATGNQAGQEPYSIDFEIINESTITHFFPYPNPFSTQCRFVFTVTGSEVPDKIMIQIMTVSGRLVKTIRGDDLGPIHIGNNITSYAWDGRDDYGDLLANGVYLYKVTTRMEGEKLERRNTVADKAFEKGFGKLYILR